MSDVPTETPAPRPRTTYPLLAGFVILGLVAYTFWNQHSAGDRLRSAGDELGLMIQGRMLVGIAELPGQQERAREELESLKTGPYRQRLLASILVAEVEGRGSAQAYLEDLEKLRQEREHQTSERDTALRETLERLYVTEPRPELTDNDRELLERYAWLGRLAISHRPEAPPEEGKELRAEALRGMILVGLLILMAFLLGLVGIALLGVAFWYWRRGWIVWSVEPRAGSGLYAEAFAVWFASFLGLGRLAAFYTSLGSMVNTGLVMLLSVAIALLWCRLRGRDFALIREEVGLHTGRSFWQELLVGIGTYAAILPMIVLAVLIIFGLTYIQDRWTTGGGAADPFAPSSRPSHPISQMILGDVWMVVMIYVTAAMIAPLVEEIAFRGLLQRYLRSYLGRLVSAVGVALIFAIIHPQGLLGVPALMAIAIPLSLVREWRGSLVAPILAHGLNNAAATTIMLLATR
jgi:membrane protease YdiL (CAAX protease family)